MDIKELIYLELLNYKAILEVYANIEDFDTMACISYLLHSGFYDNRLEFLSSYL